MEEALVEAVLEDHRTAPIEESLRAVLELLRKLTVEPETVGPEQIRAVRATGVDAQAIREAMYVAFVFNVIDRLADAFDFETSDAEHQRRTARFLETFGYWSAALSP